MSQDLTGPDTENSRGAGRKRRRRGGTNRAWPFRHSEQAIREQGTEVGGKLRNRIQGPDFVLSLEGLPRTKAVTGRYPEE